ncbi:unnamed protein product [marine sediment metagenome]|uniref:Dit-like phage tail protein N-terminal domain-containing protein n=1 Tax=marine sediment metagenome TaxID=412755 RepID=X0VGC1_9ZZZZ
MATFINDIELDYSTEINRTRDFQITTEPIQSTEFNDVTRHIKRVLPDISLLCAFINDDREEKFKRILELADNNSLIKLIQDETLENLLIQNIRETGKYETTIEFEITFKQVNLVEFATTEQPLPSKLNVIQSESKQGLQQTVSVNIEEPVYPEISITQS